MPRVDPPHRSGDRVLRDYEIQELIGSGGHAFVYRARHVVDGEEVAIKVIPEQPGRVTNVRERAKREARALVRLDHPNIVRVITGGETRGITYIVMEMMHGKVLRDVMQDVRRLSVHEALSIAVQVAEGMLEAHRLNVIHRDLKPENVFVLKDNRVKLLDFGIAKFLGYGYESTQRNMVHGTVAYMSPEQLQGFGVTDKSDVYALGTVLWEMIVGYPPVIFGVQEISMMAISHRQLSFVAPSLDEIRSEVPGYVARLVRRSLAKQAAQRETSEQFLRSLRQTLERLGQEQARAVRLNRDLLTAGVSPLLTPAMSPSRGAAEALTVRAGTPKARFGPGGTEVLLATIGPEAKAAEAGSSSTEGQGFPTVYGVPLFQPAPDSDMTRVPIPRRAPSRRSEAEGSGAEGSATDGPAQSEKPRSKDKDRGSTPIEHSLSMTSTGSWVAPKVPKWLVAVVAGAILGTVCLLLPKSITGRWTLGLAGNSPRAASSAVAVESSKPDRNAPAQNPVSPVRPAKTKASVAAPPQTNADTETPVAATPPKAPVSTEPVRTERARAERRKPRLPTAVDPTPPPPASAHAWIRMHPEEDGSMPLWIESPRERETRGKAEAEQQSSPQTPPSSSATRSFDPGELIFQ